MEILGHKNNEVWGTIYLKCYKTRLHASLIPKFPRGDTPGPPLKRTEGGGEEGQVRHDCQEDGRPVELDQHQSTT